MVVSKHRFIQPPSIAEFILHKLPRKSLSSNIFASKFLILLIATLFYKEVVTDQQIQVAGEESELEPSWPVIRQPGQSYTTNNTIPTPFFCQRPTDDEFAVKDVLNPNERIDFSHEGNSGFLLNECQCRVVIVDGLYQFSKSTLQTDGLQCFSPFQTNSILKKTIKLWLQWDTALNALMGIGVGPNITNVPIRVAGYLNQSATIVDYSLTEPDNIFIYQVTVTTFSSDATMNIPLVCELKIQYANSAGQTQNTHTYGTCETTTQLNLKTSVASFPKRSQSAGYTQGLSFFGSTVQIASEQASNNYLAGLGVEFSSNSYCLLASDGTIATSNSNDWVFDPCFMAVLTTQDSLMFIKFDKTSQQDTGRITLPANFKSDCDTAIMLNGAQMQNQFGANDLPQDAAFPGTFKAKLEKPSKNIVLTYSKETDATSETLYFLDYVVGMQQDSNFLRKVLVVTQMPDQRNLPVVHYTVTPTMATRSQQTISDCVVMTNQILNEALTSTASSHTLVIDLSSAQQAVQTCFSTSSDLSLNNLVDQILTFSVTSQALLPLQDTSTCKLNQTYHLVCDFQLTDSNTGNQYVVLRHDSAITISLNLEINLLDCQTLTNTDIQLPTCVKSLADPTPCIYSPADILSLLNLPTQCNPAYLSVQFYQLFSQIYRQEDYMSPTITPTYNAIDGISFFFSGFSQGTNPQNNTNSLGLQTYVFNVSAYGGYPIQIFLNVTLTAGCHALDGNYLLPYATMPYSGPSEQSITIGSNENINILFQPMIDYYTSSTNLPTCGEFEYSVYWSQPAAGLPQLTFDSSSFILQFVENQMILTNQTLNFNGKLRQYPSLQYTQTVIVFPPDSCGVGNSIQSTSYSDFPIIIGSGSVTVIPLTRKNSTKSSANGVSCEITQQYTLENSTLPANFFYNSSSLIVTENGSVLSGSTKQVQIFTYLGLFPEVNVTDTITLIYQDCSVSQIEYTLVSPSQVPITIQQNGNNATIQLQVSDTLSTTAGVSVCGGYAFQITQILQNGIVSTLAPSKIQLSELWGQNRTVNLTFAITDVAFPLYDQTSQNNAFTLNLAIVSTQSSPAPINSSLLVDAIIVQRCVMTTFIPTPIPIQHYYLNYTFGLTVNAPDTAATPSNCNCLCAFPIESYVATISPSSASSVFSQNGNAFIFANNTSYYEFLSGSNITVTYRPLFNDSSTVALDFGSVIDSTFIVSVEDPCLTTKISTSSQIQQLNYTIGSSPLISVLPTFTDSFSQNVGIVDFCGPIQYQVIQNGSASTFVSVNGSNLYISTQNQSLEGLQSLSLLVQLTTYQTVSLLVPFNVSIKTNLSNNNTTTQLVNAPPIISAGYVSDIIMLWNQVQNISLQFNDPQNLSFSVTTQFSPKLIYDQVLAQDNSSLSIVLGPHIQQTNQTLNESIKIVLKNTMNLTTFYTINVFLVSNQITTDNTTTQNQSQQQNQRNSTSQSKQVDQSGANVESPQNFQFQQYLTNNASKGKNQPQQVALIISEINSFGQINVSFSEPVWMTPDEKFLTQNNHVQAYFIRSSNSKVQTQRMEWSLISFNKTFSQFVVNFTNPIIISQSSQQPDKVMISFKKALLYSQSWADSQNLRKLASVENDYTNITVILPLQFSSQGEAATVKGISSSVGQMATYIFWLLFVGQFLAKSILKYLFDVFLYLQVVLAMPLLSVFVPINCMQIKQQMESIINMQLIPPGIVEPWFIKHILKESYEQYKNSEHKNLIIAILAQILLLILAVAVIGVVLIFKKLQQYYGNSVLQRIFKYLEGYLMFSPVLRIIQQSYLSTSISTVAQISAISFSSGSLIGQFFVTLLTCVFLIVYPIWCYRFLSQNFLTLSIPPFRTRWGTIYTNLNVYNMKATSWNAIFLGRRLIFAIIVGTLGSFSVIQLALNSYIGIVVLVYLIQVMPMDDKISNVIQIISEASLTGLSIFSFVFTDYIKDPKERLKIGWFIIAFVGLTVITNVCLMFGKAVVFMKRMKILRAQMLQKRILSKQQTQTKSQGEISSEKLQNNSNQKLLGAPDQQSNEMTEQKVSSFKQRKPIIQSSNKLTQQQKLDSRILKDLASKQVSQLQQNNEFRIDQSIEGLKQEMEINETQIKRMMRNQNNSVDEMIDEFENRILAKKANQIHDLEDTPVKDVVWQHQQRSLLQQYEDKERALLQNRDPKQLELLRMKIQENLNAFNEQARKKNLGIVGRKVQAPPQETMFKPSQNVKNIFVDLQRK